MHDYFTWTKRFKQFQFEFKCLGGTSSPDSSTRKEIVTTFSVCSVKPGNLFCRINSKLYILWEFFSSQGQVSTQKIYITCSGCFPGWGFLKQPAVSPHNWNALSLSRHSKCRTNPHGVSHINTFDGCLRLRYKSAASRTDSVSVRNFDAMVH